MKKFMFAFVLAISAMLAACGKKKKITLLPLLMQRVILNKSNKII